MIAHPFAPAQCLALSPDLQGACAAQRKSWSCCALLPLLCSFLSMRRSGPARCQAKRAAHICASHLCLTILGTLTELLHDCRESETVLRGLASHLQSCLEPHAQAVANSAFMFVLGRPAPSRSQQPVPPAASGKHEAEPPNLLTPQPQADEQVQVCVPHAVSCGRLTPV